MTQFRTIEETEITAPTSLSKITAGRPELTLNPDARGWSRRPLADTRLYTGFGGWGRNKRWEYWGIMTPKHIIGITISSLEYAGVNQLYVVDRETLAPVSIEVVAPLARGVTLPDTYLQGPASFMSKDLKIQITDTFENGLHETRIIASGAGHYAKTSAHVAGQAVTLELDLTMSRDATDDALHVVVPWSQKRFQYTIKEPALPATGTLRINGKEHSFGGVHDSTSFGVLDHGRGRWPYSMIWNWAAGSGIVNGQRIALQLGDKWTDGTGSTENAVIVDGRLTKISEELRWQYDTTDWLKPWKVTGQNIDATFTPFYERVAVTSLVVLAGETHQCFGTWTGSFTLPDGARISLDGLEGWAEEARNRW